MDFALVDNLVYSHSNNASQSDADVSTLRLYGSDAEPVAKLAKISSRGGDTSKLSLTHHHAPPPFLRSSSGYGYGVRGPFTPSQWMELEHQALIYKYITANVPIPSYLLNPIMRALQHSGFNCFSLLRPNALGWGGFDKGDPEPGRCRRTDGKKWRCSREAVTDQKYCERHINRGRHRSRKPVEGGAAANNHTSTKSTTRCPSPTSKEASKMSLEDNGGDTSELSMGLGIGADASEQSQRRNGWGGGPLGEALHTTTSSNTVQCKALNLIPTSTLGVLGGAFAGTG